VSGQQHAPAALYPGERPGTHFTGTELPDSQFTSVVTRFRWNAVSQSAQNSVACVPYSFYGIKWNRIHACTIKLCGFLTVGNALVKSVYCVTGCSTICTVIFHFSVPEHTLLIIIIITSSSGSIIIWMSIVTGLFFLILLLNQRWSPPLRLQASHCSTFRTMCDVPSIAVFCSEYIIIIIIIISHFLIVSARSKAWVCSRRLPVLWIRIPPEAWMSVVSVVYCQVEVCATGWSLV